MRLPSLTDQQRRQEEARELHERLWEAFLRGQRVFIAYRGSEVASDSHKLVDCLHRFWLTRGFHLRVKQAKDLKGYWLWVDAKTGREAAA